MTLAQNLSLNWVQNLIKMAKIGPEPNHTAHMRIDLPLWTESLHGHFLPAEYIKIRRYTVEPSREVQLVMGTKQNLQMKKYILRATR